MRSWKRGRVSFSQMAFYVNAMNLNLHLMFGISDGVSVGAIYDTVKPPKLRFYIATQHKALSRNYSTTDSDYVVTEVSDSQSLSSVSMWSCLWSKLGPEPGPEESVSACCQRLSSCYRSPSGLGLHRSSTGNIAVGPQPASEVNLDDTLIYQPETPNHPPCTKTITIHHANCCNNMIEAFSDPSEAIAPW